MSFNRDRLDAPDLVTVLPHRAVGREESAASRVEDRHLGPVIVIRVCVSRSLAAINVRLEIGIVPKDREIDSPGVWDPKGITDFQRSIGIAKYQPARIK